MLVPNTRVSDEGLRGVQNFSAAHSPPLCFLLVLCSRLRCVRTDVRFLPSRVVYVVVRFPLSWPLPKPHRQTRRLHKVCPAVQQTPVRCLSACERLFGFSEAGDISVANWPQARTASTEMKGFGLAVAIMFWLTGSP